MWLDQLTAFAQEQLGEEEREALWSRGVSDGQIQLFRLGSLNKTLPDLAYPKNFLEWCWNGRRFDHVFVLPLTNALNQVRGLQFRHVDRDRSGYSSYMPYEEEPVLFGLGQAIPHIWKTRSVCLVEGAFDVFPIQRIYPDTFSTLTARLTQPVTTLLRRFVDEIWLGYDTDRTGRTAVARVQRTHGQEFKVNPVVWPRVRLLDGSGLVKDPSDLWEAWGDERLKTFLQQSMRRRRNA